MLHEFLTLHREELIRRCRSRACQRSSPPATPSELEHGISSFLSQLVDALRREHGSPASKETGAPASSDGCGTAALHGKDLLEEGCTVEQVVHSYGDVCQVATEMAAEKKASFTVAEYHVFNCFLDNAIAAAVSSYEGHREASISAVGAQDLHQQLGTLADRQRDLVNTALKALDALKVGNIGLLGATGSLLEDSLVGLRELIDKSLPEIRLKNGMSRPPSRHGTIRAAADGESPGTASQTRIKGAK